MSLEEIGGGIATGMILAGIFTMILAIFNLFPLINKILTPTVMSVYLFLLTFQLVFTFFTGMLKINDNGKLDLPISLFSIVIVIFVCLLNILGKKAISNFSILIGMIVGWIGYDLLFPENIAMASKASSLTLFPFGQPNLQVSIILITFLGCLVNLSNTRTTVEATSKILNETASSHQYKSSYLLTGLYAALAPVFGLISYSPYASSIGFLESTKMVNKRPFLVGGGLMVLLGIIPALGSLLATLPITVGNAVLFVAYLQLFGTSIKSLNGYQFTSKTIYRLAIPILVGISIMTLDSKVFTSLPIYLQPLFGNGFIVGVLLSVFIEKLIKWDKVVD